ncbi:hypothetical protein SUDANB99_05077 [Streptomyces sp. enrichment culture]
MWGAGVVALLAGSGSLPAFWGPEPPEEAAKVLTYAAAGFVLLLLIGYGLVLALVHSWFTRHGHWVVPALAPALGLAPPWSGGLLHTMYLRGGFGRTGPGERPHLGGALCFVVRQSAVGDGAGMSCTRFAGTLNAPGSGVASASHRTALPPATEISR